MLVMDGLGLLNIILIIHYKKKEPVLSFPKSLGVFLHTPFVFTGWNLGLGGCGYFRQDWTHEQFHGFQWLLCWCAQSPFGKEDGH